MWRVLILVARSYISVSKYCIRKLHEKIFLSNACYVCSSQIFSFVDAFVSSPFSPLLSLFLLNLRRMLGIKCLIYFAMLELICFSSTIFIFVCCMACRPALSDLRTDILYLVNSILYARRTNHTAGCLLLLLTPA